MAYSESLAYRIRDVFAGRRGVTERKMFGGVGFMLYGNIPHLVAFFRDRPEEFSSDEGVN